MHARSAFRRAGCSVSVTLCIDTAARRRGGSRLRPSSVCGAQRAGRSGGVARRLLCAGVT